MEMRHFSHDHPLMFTEKQKYDVNKRVWYCNGCNLRIYPDDPSYSCNHHGCNFKLHKVCAELPREIKEHLLHPNHLLTLLPSYDCLCDACDKSWNKFTYHCASCDFDLDPFCALPSIMGMYHIRHPDHPLMFTEEQQYDVGERVWFCDGCDLAILPGNPSYNCSLHRRKFKLHKVCAELSTKIKEHPLHANHTLTLTYRPLAKCNACKRSSKKFTYACIHCDFDLDIFCAFPSIMGVHHFSHHQHPLIFTEEQKYAVDAKAWCCDGCDLPISPDNPSYSCIRHDCEFKLHKVCAELPREIKEHRLHPNHTLTLLDYFYAPSPCAACGRGWKKFSYHCESCTFVLDPFCALPLTMEKEPETEMERHYFSHHHHPLMFTEEQKYDVNESVWCCDGCDLPISPDNPSYSCNRHGCKFKLHKVCAELPREEKEHLLHPNHTLILNPYPDSTCICDACHRSSKKFTYACRPCNFDLDIFCAFPSKMGQGLLLKHPSHHHQLTLLLVQALFLCSGCDTKHSEGHSYLCTTCNKFWIHQECALLPSIIKCHDLHDNHPLVLAFSIPEKYTTFWISCNICSYSMRTSSWLYYCGGCRYFAHVNCAIGNREPFMSILLPDCGQRTGYGKKAEDIDESELIHLPVVDESSWITNHFSKKTSIRTAKHDDDKIINHFSHPNHLLILFNDSNKEESSSEQMHHKKNTTIASPSTSTSDGRKFCSGCLQTILKSTPYYGCVLCNYFLHQDCALLPTELLHHPLHPKLPLVLLPQGPLFFGLFWCYCCKRFCNGFRYGHNTYEDYCMDLKCASLPTLITHKAHLPNHTLVLVSTEIEDFAHACHACRYNITWTYYKCESCDFKIDSSCAQLPHTIEHRYDKHPFVLTYGPLKNHQEEYFCEICEEELNPQEWFYHCTTCDQSIHPFCYFDRNENLKYGGTIIVSCHPHPLAFAKSEWDSNCDYCDEFIQASSDFDIFECLRCVKYKMHRECAKSCVVED